MHILYKVLQTLNLHTEFMPLLLVSVRCSLILETDLLLEKLERENKSMLTVNTYKMHRGSSTLNRIIDSTFQRNPTLMKSVRC